MILSEPGSRPSLQQDMSPGLRFLPRLIWPPQSTLLVFWRPCRHGSSYGPLERTDAHFLPFLCSSLSLGYLPCTVVVCCFCVFWIVLCFKCFLTIFKLPIVCFIIKLPNPKFPRAWKGERWNSTICDCNDKSVVYFPPTLFLKFSFCLTFQAHSSLSATSGNRSGINMNAQ